MRPDAALLFAAGFGTRMAPLTDTLPKPLIPVAGRPLIDHALDLTRQAGITRVAANTHYLAPLLSQHLQRRGVAESHEPDILDTGGALKHALPLLGDGEAVITLNTDAVWQGGAPLTNLMDGWDPDRMSALLSVIPRAKAVGHIGKGDFSMDAEGRLKPGRDFIYTGAQVIGTQPFAETVEEAFPMIQIWKQMVEDGRMFGSIYTGQWCDVGRPDCIPLAEDMLGSAHV